MVGEGLLRIITSFIHSFTLCTFIEYPLDTMLDVGKKDMNNVVLVPILVRQLFKLCLTGVPDPVQKKKRCSAVH